MIDNYKQKYKLKTEYDLQLNQFPRGLKGELSDYDVYIECQNKMRIFSYGHGILQAYIPSLGRGRNILKAIAEIVQVDVEKYIYQEEYTNKNGEVNMRQIYDYDNFYHALNENKTIFNIEETDSEILFKFHSKNFSVLEPFLKPKQSTSGRSPFSTKNLRKIKYEMSSEDLSAYKEITTKIPSTDILKLSTYTNDFIKSLTNKSKTLDDIKLDMSKKCIKGKDYIHSLGDKTWNNYLGFLKGEICRDYEKVL
ncbi:hypothetical protein [Konateibacter massiliensis]|uniref:hypothetical protein n=1 Tax=Konateibacter massiliensis TaxID=2002841 RepID=UPI000C154AC4|nr:hypothetical protein [Konateibacter massiliensis]